MVSSEPESPPNSFIPGAAALTRDPAFIEFATRTLGDSELADGLAPEQMAKLAAIGTLHSYAAGELVCDEHEQTDELYIIETGSVEVWLDPASIGKTDGEPRRIAALQAGQTCGELALLDGGVRSAQLRAGLHGARLLNFSRHDLLTLCETDTGIGYRMMRNLAASLALRLRLQDMKLYSNDE